ncbi:hypothetical protein PZA11_008000 [Diplocarpon coronariae]
MGTPCKHDPMQLSRALAGIESNKAIDNKGLAVFATRESLLDAETPSQAPASSSRNRSTSSRREIRPKCPCGGSKNHYWKPQDCRKLLYAMDGRKENMKALPSREEVLRIQKALNAGDQFKGLRAWLKENNIAVIAIDKFKGKASASGEDGSGNKRENSPVFTVMDPSAFDAFEESFNVYHLSKLERHPLSLSTLLDNCAATHIVNSKDLLVAGTFKPSGDSQQCVEAGTSRLPIIGRGDRYMADSLLQRDGSPMGMTLRNVAVIEEFTTNIISERLLADKGFWYSGVDLTLRSGSIGDSVKRAQLERRHNLVFFEYKPVNYLDLPNMLQRDFSALMAFPTAETTLHNRFQSSYAPTRVRDDDAYTWHLRAGHLGAEALQALVKCARGVKIRGIQRLECPACAVASARQVIPRATSENRSPRPFFRISWDLFDFPNNSYNSCSWVLLIKDEYSGMLWTFPLRSKGGDVVMEVLQAFEARVKRQYRLSICKIRQDNDTSVISPREDSLTEYQR